jgi:hypothetical protein
MSVRPSVWREVRTSLHKAVKSKTSCHCKQPNFWRPATTLFLTLPEDSRHLQITRLFYNSIRGLVCPVNWKGWGRKSYWTMSRYATNPALLWTEWKSQEKTGSAAQVQTDYFPNARQARFIYATCLIRYRRFNSIYSELTTLLWTCSDFSETPPPSDWFQWPVIDAVSPSTQFNRTKLSDTRDNNQCHHRDKARNRA